MFAMHACFVSRPETPNPYKPLNPYMRKPKPYRCPAAYMHDIACCVHVCRFFTCLGSQVCFVHPRRECRIIHGPWRHTGRSLNNAPVLCKSWHDEDPDPTPAWLFKLRGPWWVVASSVVENETDSEAWSGVDVLASIEGEELPQGRVYCPWDRWEAEAILPVWSQGLCQAIVEVFEGFSTMAWANEASYLSQIQRLEARVQLLKDEKTQLDLLVEQLFLDAAELHDV